MLNKTKIYELYNREKFRKSILSYPPLWVTIGITSACMQRCKFCGYHCVDAKGKSNVYGLPFELSVDDFVKMVNICRKGSVPHIHICGTGEPLLHKGFFEMLDYLQKVYGESSFQTNFNELINKVHKNFLSEIIKRKDKINYISTDIMSGIPKEHESVKINSKLDYVFNCLYELSRYADNIRLNLFFIITKKNYRNISSIISNLEKRKIKASLQVVDLMPLGFNDFTEYDNVVTRDDVEIINYLKNIKLNLKSDLVSFQFPDYFNTSNNRGCHFFWQKFQTWPVKGIDADRYSENVITCACNAVVQGKLNSLGYFFDYDNIMDLWNNDIFVKIRENLIKGIYPDEYCKYCIYGPRKSKIENLCAEL